MFSRIIISTLILLTITCANHSRSGIPESFQGKWMRIPSNDITDQSGLEFNIRILQDTIITYQSVMGMAGIEQSLQRFTFEKTVMENDTTLRIELKDTQTSTFINIIFTNGQLIISNCVSDGGNNSNANYTGCTEWGTFAQMKQ